MNSSSIGMLPFGLSQSSAARANVLMPVRRPPRHKPRIVAESNGDGRSHLVVRSSLNIALLVSCPFENELRLASAIDEFKARCVDEGAYRIDTIDEGQFDIVLATEDGRELGRAARPALSHELAKATVRLVAQQARQAEQAG